MTSVTAFFNSDDPTTSCEHEGCYQFILKVTGEGRASPSDASNVYNGTASNVASSFVLFLVLWNLHAITATLHRLLHSLLRSSLSYSSHGDHPSNASGGFNSIVPQSPVENEPTDATSATQDLHVVTRQSSTRPRSTVVQGIRPVAAPPATVLRPRILIEEPDQLNDDASRGPFATATGLLVPFSGRTPSVAQSFPSPDNAPPSPTPSNRSESVPSPTSEISRGKTEPSAQRGSSLPLTLERPADPTRTLYIGSSRLTSILHLFVVAYGHEGTDRYIEDPDYDTNLLCNESKKLNNVVFYSLLGDNASLDRINSTITDLWNKALPGAHLLLLLTGHGGDDNAMLLPGGEAIDESYLNALLQSLYESAPKDIEVIIVFNICRENPNKTATTMGPRVALIWSCSPGQQSWAFKFRSIQSGTLPMSSFLIGLFMASSDERHGLGTIEERLKLRVSQLAKFNCYITHVRNCEACDWGKTPCSESSVMTKAFEQDVDLDQSKEALKQLTSLLGSQASFIELSDGVMNTITNNKPFLRSNNLPLPETSDRGASGSVAQVSGGVQVTC